MARQTSKVRAAANERTPPAPEVVARLEDSILNGLPLVIHGAVVRRIDAAGEETYEIPDQLGLVATFALSRALMPAKLRGAEIRSLRKSMDMLARELAEALDTTPETVSRWENDSQAMSASAEKLFRLLVCERLKDQAQAVAYRPDMLLELRLAGPTDGLAPVALEFERIRLRLPDGGQRMAWQALPSRPPRAIG